MTTHQPTRLDRIEALVEANSRAIDRNTANITRLEQSVATNTTNIDRNTADIQRLRETVEIDSQNVRQLAATVQIQQQTLQATASALIEEIRGLWAENRRILACLFGSENGVWR
jgi:chromosome segregation ATPase